MNGEASGAPGGLQNETRRLWLRKAVLVAAVGLVVVLAATWLYLRSTGWDGQYSRTRLTAGRRVVLPENSALLTVPAGWTGEDILLWALPPWLGFNQTGAGTTRMVLIQPEAAASLGGICIYTRDGKPDWSALKPLKPTTPKVELNDDLRSRGVVLAMIRPSALSPDGVGVWLFVNRRPQRMIIELARPSLGGQLPTAEEVSAALTRSGLTLPPQ